MSGHDELCDYWRTDFPCQCDLITRVRNQIADEIHARRDSQSNAGAIQWNGAISCAEGIARGKRV